MTQFDHTSYVSMTMEFRCNLKCVHCMIEGTMDELVPESTDKFRELLELNAKERRWRGLILTGSEITLLNDLPELAMMARDAGFDHVRIQTHGMKLAREDYLATLVDAGVNEFFISVAGSDEASHDEITTVPGSFKKTLKGLENIEKYDDVISITNSVVTSRSYHLLPRIVESLAHLKRLQQMEFWVYWPMKETDEKNLVPRFSEMLPYMKQAISAAQKYGRDMEIKNFPQCLLGKDGDLLLNDQPQLYIDPDFWTQFMRNGFYQCVYKEQCASNQCLGLNSAYIQKYGWEADILHPLLAPLPGSHPTR